VAAVPVRNCLVTGAGSGIGRAIAHALAATGGRVIVAGRRRDALEETAATCPGPGSALVQPMDVRDREAVAAAVGAALAAVGGGLHVLVNNAGVGGPNRCGGAGPDRWHEIVRTNLDGVFHVTEACVPHLADGGRVISISSVLGKFGVPGYTAYCASKHGVIGFTKALAHELAPRRITVNAICPGWVETEMARAGLELLARAGGTGYQEARQAALAQVPLGRMIDPADVGALVVYLAGQAAADMTGQAISLCGGSTMG
jgi:NAD(P)-dependent dehydrogenase (short-subunit alcohol dehydrogenase family)